MNRLLPAAIRVLSVEEVSPGFPSALPGGGQDLRVPNLPRGDLPAVRAPLRAPLSLSAGCGAVHGAWPRCSRASTISRPSRPPMKTTLWAAPRSARFSPRACGVEAGCLLYRVRGSGFLKHMVRNLVGTLLEAGKGNLGEEELRELARARRPAEGRPYAAGPRPVSVVGGILTFSRTAAAVSFSHSPSGSPMPSRRRSLDGAPFGIASHQHLVVASRRRRRLHVRHQPLHPRLEFVDRQEARDVDGQEHLAVAGRRAACANSAHLVAHGAAAEHRAQNLDHHGQPVPFVAAQRHQQTVVRLACVRGRDALGSPCAQPAGNTRLLRSGMP